MKLKLTLLTLAAGLLVLPASAQDDKKPEGAPPPPGGGDRGGREGGRGRGTPNPEMIKKLGCKSKK